MKSWAVLFIAVLIAMFTMVTPEKSVAQEHGKAGDKAVLFTFHGFSFLSVGNVNGGFGLRYYLADGLSLRASYGSLVSNDAAPVTYVSGAALFNVGQKYNTTVYIGPTLAYSHSPEVVDAYSFGAEVGADFYPWDNISFNAHYPLVVTHVTGTQTTTWEFGTSTGDIGLSVWF